MRHLHRTHITPAEVMSAADAFFTRLGLTASESTDRGRAFDGPLGSLRLTARPEGGHYTFVEANTDQMGESRLDRNVKRFFVRLHTATGPGHRLEASY